MNEYQRAEFLVNGLLVLRKVLPDGLVALWGVEYQRHIATHGRAVEWNKVAVSGPFPDAIESIPDALVDVVQPILGSDVGLYNLRFVVKDRHMRDGVFTHQDCAYHMGGRNKLSAFIPLTRVTPENGGLYFYPGTHKFGYLGDAGEINVPTGILPVHPSVNPGDVVLMHSDLWHGSHECTSGEDRIIVDCILQPSHDPSTKRALTGIAGRLPWGNDYKIFKRSRVSRIKQLEEELASHLVRPTIS